MPTYRLGPTFNPDWAWNGIVLGGGDASGANGLKGFAATDKRFLRVAFAHVVLDATAACGMFSPCPSVPTSEGVRCDPVTSAHGMLSPCPDALKIGSVTSGGLAGNRQSINRGESSALLSYLEDTVGFDELEFWYVADSDYVVKNYGKLENNGFKLGKIRSHRDVWAAIARLASKRKLRLFKIESHMTPQ